MWIFIRQGSASKNLADLIPTVLRHGTERIALCSDDREPDTILARRPRQRLRPAGRGAAACGVEDALVLATSNPAQYHNLRPPGLAGARLPGRRALLRLPGPAAARPGLPGGPARRRGRPGRGRRGSRRAGARTGCAARCTWPACPAPEALPLDPPAGRPGQGHRHRARTRSPPGTWCSTCTDPAAAVARIAVAERHLRHRPDRARLRARLRAGPRRDRARPWPTTRTTA